MTIAIVVKVSEGLVMAADSAMAVQGQLAVPGQPVQQGLLKVYNHATKITQICDWPIGVVTFGMAQIAGRTIESLLHEFSDGYEKDQPKTVKQVADDLHAFVAGRHAATPGAGELGMQLAGYAPNQFFPEQYFLGFPPGKPGVVTEVRPNQADGSPDFGANWYGLTDAIVRLYMGFDPEAKGKLSSAGVTDDQLAALQPLQYPVIFEAMPLQDAIDFAAWLADVTIGRYRFVIGPGLVVGPVDIAIITRHEGFKFIRHKLHQVSPEHPFLF